MEKKESKKDNNSLSFIKVLWKIIKLILIGLLLLVFIVIIVQRISNNKMSVAGYGVYTVVSESMVPEYKVFDMLFAKKTNPTDINVGDDVVYQGKEGDFAGKIVTHRVIKKRGTPGTYTFTTKGIANDLEDPEIDDSQIMGKVLFKSVILSLISKVLSNTYGFYFLVFVPFVVIVTFEIIDTVNERKRLKEKG